MSHSPSSILRARFPTPLAAVAALVVAALVAVPAVGTVTATPAPTSVPATSDAHSWAFGNVTNRLTIQGGNAFHTFTGTATYGFVTNVTAVNTSATTIEVISQATIGLSLKLHSCSPNCSAPVQVTDFSYQAWETYFAWTNLSTVASMTEVSLTNGSVLPNVTALGIINSSTQSRGYVHESATLISPSTSVGNSTRIRSIDATSTSNSSSSVSFTPALGILPILPTGPIGPGTYWTSTAAYASSASWGAQWFLAVNLSGSAISRTFNGSIGHSTSATGSVTLIGRATEIHVRQVRLLSLAYSLGPDFRLGPGLSVGWMVPGAFGEGLEGSTSWAAYMVAGANVQMHALDADPSAGLITWLRSSEVSFSVNVFDPNHSGMNDTTGPTTVTGYPMTSSQAGTYANCLQQASVCSTTGFVQSGGTGAIPSVVLVGAAVAVLAVVVAAVVVVRQRRMPPPKYPNAGLYPPGQPVGPAEPSPPAGPATSPPPPEPGRAEDDPLGQLW